MTAIERLNKHAKSGYWSLIFWALQLPVLGMMFDAPNSQSHFFPWVVVCIALLIPIAIFAGPSVARRLLERGKVKTAFAIVLAPQALIVAPLLLAVFAALITGVWSLWKL